MNSVWYNSFQAQHTFQTGLWSPFFLHRLVLCPQRLTTREIFKKERAYSWEKTLQHGMCDLWAKTKTVNHFWWDEGFSYGGHCYCHPHQNDQHISKLAEHLHIVDSPHSLGACVISFLILKVEKPSEGLISCREIFDSWVALADRTFCHDWRHEGHLCLSSSTWEPLSTCGCWTQKVC